MEIAFAQYLKAPWAKPFEVSATKPGPFHVNGEQSIDVPMMTQAHELPYAEGDGFTAVELPFGGQELQFLILLPKRPRGLPSLEEKISSDAIAGKLKWETRQVTLYLPKFKLEPPTLPLGTVMQTLGMKTAFDIPPGSANFDRIAARHPDDHLYISELFHETFLNLDEKGAEGAASTSVHFSLLGEIPERPKPVEVRVDHPFLFAIHHQPSGACLFLGHVTDPR